MTSKTNELALETAIEKALCGISTEELNFAKVQNFGKVDELNEPYRSNGYRIGNPLLGFSGNNPERRTGKT
mgnify:CR=1 FL=1